MVIKSSTALRTQYTMISDLAHETGEPIFITKNGDGDVVVMSVEAYEEQEELWRLKARLEVAEQSVLAGNAVSIDGLRARLRELYSNGE